ncbi:MAG: pyridoxal phosphate-dependent aminotransferase [Thermoplasmata archaeon]|nr:pyridoxal phosphate-dependent aminotransferase [Thermoplasmata archaeon]
MVEFETGKWILSHQGKYNLSQSGMSGRINLDKYFKSCSFGDENNLKEIIANLNNDSKENVVITHGATEALFLVLYHLKEHGSRKFSVERPEYEPLFKDPPALGYEESNKGVFIFSNTNNPTGVELKIKEFYDAYVVDDTFLQFSKDLDSARYPENTYRINTFTKFYGGDEVRIGYIIAPSKDLAERINYLKGIFTEQVSKFNICVAESILKDNDEIKKFVRNEMKRNLSFLKKNMGGLKFYKNVEPEVGTVTFLDYSYYTSMDSRSVAEYLFKNQISIVPAEFFGVNGPYLRVCYTRENFQESFVELIKNLENLKK